MGEDHLISLFCVTFYNIQNSVKSSQKKNHLSHKTSHHSFQPPKHKTSSYGLDTLAL